MNSLEKRRPGASGEEEGGRQYRAVTDQPRCWSLCRVPGSGGARAEEGQHVEYAVRGCKRCALETEILQYEDEDSLRLVLEEGLS